MCVLITNISNIFKDIYETLDNPDNSITLEQDLLCRSPYGDRHKKSCLNPNRGFRVLQSGSHSLGTIRRFPGAFSGQGSCNPSIRSLRV